MHSSSDPSPRLKACNLAFEYVQGKTLAEVLREAGRRSAKLSVNDDVKRNDILRMSLQAMYSPMGLRHVVLGVSEKRLNVMQGTFSTCHRAECLRGL
ncbi:hypothetical protein [Thiobacter aerophilum]|uniref:Uncharacterized protein n=1 Tax=Thiobacter aerophilum TaxID=3121275 RepID=A0ABV0EKB5_9BURK